MTKGRAGVFTTYGIIDPRTSVFIYIGQTKNFEHRKLMHMDALHRPRPRIRSVNIRTWMYDTLSLGITPLFVILETVDAYEKSIASEAEWVARLAAENHPLLNKWRAHKHIIDKTQTMNKSRATTLDSIGEVIKRKRKHHESLTNHGQPWTPQEDRTLLEMFRQGNGGKDIAATLDRTLTSIRARLVRLGEVPNRKSVKE